jgi:predicted CXXCH cytochrome family protein
MSKSRRPTRLKAAHSPHRVWLWIVTALITLAAGTVWWCSAHRWRPASRADVPLVILDNPALMAASHFPPHDAARCAPCHQEIFDAWAQSQHARANRLVNTAIDRAAFHPDRSLTHGGFTTSFSLRGTQAWIRTQGPAGDHTHRAEAAIGVTPLVQYLVPFPGGRLQAVDIAHDPRTNEWFDTFPGENRQPHEWGFWTNRALNWNSQCAFCHMTELRKNYDPATDAYRTTWKAMGISCSQCHTLTEEHMAHPHDPMPGLRLATNLAMENCASCHARREELTPDFRAGERFHDHYRLALADVPGVFHPDGQVQQEDFEYAAFRYSRMGHKGIACLECHDPHSGLLTLPVQNDALCMKCHAAPGQQGAPVIQRAAHAFHPLDAPGGRCVDCHMPETTYMARDARRDHSFNLPDPWLTLKAGVPNACNRCHADKDAQWAADWTAKWYDTNKITGRVTHHRALAIAGAWSNETGWVTNVLAFARREENPAWRATLTALLANAPNFPAVREFLQGALADPDPLVRSHAVRALQELPDAAAALTPRLDDPARLVRLDAAWALYRPGALPPAREQELTAYLRNICDQPSGALRQAGFAERRGDPAEAARWMTRVAQWDDTSENWRALGILHHSHNQPAEAEAALRRSLQRDPVDAESHFTLALMLGEAGRVDDVRKHLELAVQHQPAHGRAWYNLGLIKAGQNQLAEAARDLRQAERFLPDSADAPFALATVFARQGDRAAARDALRRALRADPAHAPSRQLQLQLAVP